MNFRVLTVHYSYHKPPFEILDLPLIKLYLFRQQNGVWHTLIYSLFVFNTLSSIPPLRWLMMACIAWPLMDEVNKVLIFWG